MQLGYCNSLIGQNRPRVVSGLAYTLYVDSVAGDDLNDGSAAGAPVQTLARAVELAGDNAIIGLKRGGVWRESLDLSTLTAPTVALYGSSGDLPQISGADIVTDWTATGGTTNVWQKSIAHDSSGTNRLRVYEDGVQLTRVDDQAACDSQAGSFVKVLGSAGSPATIKIHPTDSGNPNSNGSVYEVTVRQVGIIGPDDATIIGINTGHAISNNGSLDLINTTGGSVQRSLAVYGSKHNLGVGAAVVSDSIAVLADTTIAEEPSNIQLIGYMDDPSGEVIIWRRCGVVGLCPGQDQYSHGNPNPFDSVTMEQCWTAGTGGFAVAAAIILGGYYDTVLNLPLQAGDVSKTIMRLMADGGATSPATYDDTTITDCCIVAEQRVVDNFNEVFRTNQAHKATFDHVSMFCDTSLSTGNYTIWFANGNSDQDIELDHCIVFNGHSQMRLASGGSYVGDFNVFIAGVPGDTNQVIFLHHTAGGCVTLAAWQAATSQDANSVWLARADQARGNAYAFWLGVANDENDGPADGDWRINPDCRVYGGDNTPYIGTFADGTTAITEAGAQTHWDWAARASASGPPSAWPTVPRTLADAKTYALAPESWNFYP